MLDARGHLGNFHAAVSTLQTPLVSVVIPVFNSAGLVGQTLEALRLQTFQNFEALIVDDGSTDDTAAFVSQFCQADPRLRLVSRPHAGLSGTRNAGMEQARGEFIAFLDHDDIWFPEKLARQMELFRADPRVNFSYTNYFFWDGQRDFAPGYREHRPLPDGDAGRQLAFSNIYGMSTVVVRREMFERAGCFDTSFDGCEDWDMWLRLAEHGLWARGTREPLARYRRWPGNMSNQKIKMATGDVLVLEKNLRATRRAELRPLYRQALSIAQGKLELARARPLIEAQPEKIPAAVWRAWRFHPSRLKWLMWFLLVAWPGFLGGNKTARVVHRKLVEKF
jgi:glycosyltransferase involved in cell wall biosynthesis